MGEREKKSGQRKSSSHVTTRAHLRRPPKGTQEQLQEDLRAIPLSPSQVEGPTLTRETSSTQRGSEEDAARDRSKSGVATSCSSSPATATATAKGEGEGEGERSKEHTGGQGGTEAEQQPAGVEAMEEPTSATEDSGSRLLDEGVVFKLEVAGCLVMLAVILGLLGYLWHLRKTKLHTLEVRERVSGTRWTIISVALTLLIFAVTYYNAYSYKKMNDQIDAEHRFRLIVWNFVKILLVVLTIAVHLVYYKMVKIPDAERQKMYGPIPRRSFSVGWKVWGFFVLGVLAMALAKITVKFARDGFRVKPLRRSPQSRMESKRKSLPLLNPHEL